MDGIDAAGIYFAVRSAFTGNYDYFKYNGAIKITKEAFAIHKNRWQFIELGKKYPEKTLPFALAVNFMHFGTEDMWIPNYLSNFAQHDNMWHEWQMYNLDRITNFRKWIRHFAEMYHIKDKTEFRHKMLTTSAPYTYYQGNNDKVNLLSTFILLDSVIKIFEGWDVRLKGSFVWDEEYARIKKFMPFFYNYKPISDINLRKSLDSIFTFP